MEQDALDSGETRDLLRQVEAGDRWAVDQLLVRHRAYLRRFVEVRLDPKLRPRVDPSDVVQEAQLEAVRRLPGYLEQRPMPFRLWLRQIAYDRLLMQRRKHLNAEKRAAAREMPLPDRSSAVLAQQLLASGPTPSEQLHRADLTRRVRHAVEQLPQAHREVLLMRDTEGLSYQEIGYLLQIAPDAARQRYGRALVRLRQLLVAAGLTETQL